MAKTIESVFRDASYRPSGFDYMRIILASLVIVMHSVATSNGIEANQVLWESPLGGFFKLILPMFFALSGFLVSGSMDRCETIISFAGLRLIRIYPALAVEVLISAILIGPIVTTVSLQSYFTDPQFLRYLVNVTGHISYILPGVFEDNPLPDIVNGQLWTVKWELACYIVLIGLIILGIKKHRIVGIIGFLAYGALCLFDQMHGNDGLVNTTATYVPGKVLVLYFLAGVIGYQFRSSIPYSPILIALSGLASYILLAKYSSGPYIALLPTVYLTIGLGVTEVQRSWLSRIADASYGVFLYGFAVQQFYAWLIGGTHPWWLNLGLALPTSIVIGLLSWNLLEKPIMKRRKIVYWVEDRSLQLLGMNRSPKKTSQ